LTIKIYKNKSLLTNNAHRIYDAPGIALSCIVLLMLASDVGTFGNIMILIVVSKTKELRQTQSIFIINLAISDMYVTLIADPMSIVMISQFLVHHE
jgi:hypothetical protein